MAVAVAWFPPPPHLEAGSRLRGALHSGAPQAAELRWAKARLWRLVLDGCWGLKTVGNGALGPGGFTVVARNSLERQARAPAPSLACLQSASSAPA